jgi:CheY-like chemotaxis protein
MKSVLVVDDNDLVRNLIVTILEDAGIEALTAATGTEAIKLVTDRGDNIGCVLQDLSMPIMTGDKVVAALLEIDPNLPIIILSVDDAAYSAARLSELDIAGYIQKPFDADELVIMVRDKLR